MKTRIYIVEDDPDIAELLDFNLQSSGYETKSEPNGKKAYDMIMKDPPDLLILDLNLPELSGIQICKFLRENARTKNLPVIMLTAKAQETDKVIGLNIGADDYITKPFSVKELIARIKALLRRINPVNSDSFIYKELEVNFALKQVKIKNKEIEITPIEFKLITAFINSRGRALSREDILNIVWGNDYSGEIRTVDVNIKRLRDKLNPYGEIIQTVKGTGYRFKT
ncbi:MAG: response regulator [Ignavibacteria bacterium]|nr:response regulator [Ignavibacteria bacterium]